MVSSSTLRSPLSWDKAELVPGDAVAAVRDMKRDGTRPLRTLGSPPRTKEACIGLGQADAGPYPRWRRRRNFPPLTASGRPR